MGNSKNRGYLNSAICITLFIYGFIVSILLLDPDTSCYEAVGGKGCGVTDDDS